MSPSRPAASPAPDPRDGAKPLVARRSLVDDAHFDVTAMVDLVFMMNIFFLVSWVVANLAEMDLPDRPALHGLRPRYHGGHRRHRQGPASRPRSTWARPARARWLTTRPRSRPRSSR